MAEQKEYDVFFKFSGVSQTIKADSLREAKDKADELLNTDQTPKADTYCYETEVEEVK